MSVLWKIDLESDARWEEASARARTTGLKAATLGMAEQWKSKYLGEHFTLPAAGRYGYQPRKESYLKKKLRAGSTEKTLYGGTRSRASFSKVALSGAVDLIYTGLLRRRILKGSTVHGYPTRATVNLRGTDYFTTRPRNPERPNLAREIMRIIDSERVVLRGTASKRFFEVLAQRRGRGRPRKKPIA